MDAASVTPSSLLLATDLSARCDRAFDRALLLARQWRARLVLATVLPSTQELDFHEQILGTPPWQRPALLAQKIERRLRRDLGELDVALTVRVETGAPGPALRRVAQQEQCGLIVAGVARGTLFSHPRLGSTVSWLARHARLPLLVVHRRPVGAYRSMVLASDFSATTRRALRLALGLFGTPATLALLHGFEVPRLGQRDTPQGTAQEQARRKALACAGDFIQTLQLPASLRVEVVAADAEPSRLLRDFVRDHDTELAIVGSHGRSALRGLLLGDVGGRILATVQTDTLLVRDAAEAD